MDWVHQVDGEWLKARQDVVTATELQSLLAGRNKWTKAQKVGAEVAPAFAALWGSKHRRSDPDPWSYGAAARGHVMEPWAVREYNAAKGREFYHWDDCIICNNGLGFSPDAMDIPPLPIEVPKIEVVRGKFVRCETKEGRDISYEVPYDMPSSILEIKCYGIDNHMRNLVARKQTLKERYQIAVAMMVLPTLREGILVQYNPDTEYSMFDRVYTREELEEEIEELSEALDMWNKACRWFDANQPEIKTMYTEDEIYRCYFDEKEAGSGIMSFK